eukprot:7964731-Alexandrium_andersonii.AAC.1
MCIRDSPSMLRSTRIFGRVARCRKPVRCVAPWRRHRHRGEAPGKRPTPRRRPLSGATDLD